MKAMKINIIPKAELNSKLRKAASNFDSGKSVKPIKGTCFESMKAVRKFLTDNRLNVWRTIRDKKPSSITALSKLLKRDFKTVHSDVMILEAIGLVSIKKEKGQRGDVQVPVSQFDELVLAVA
jgi:predicted transcriptional regulator